MYRRDFFKKASLYSTTAFGFLNPFMSQLMCSPNINNEDHYFVLIQVGGGWDVTLSLDPKTHQSNTDQNDLFIEYRPDEIIQSSGLMFGPSFSPMIKHSNDIHIIRGIEMRRDAGHSTNLEIISSGHGDGESALFPIELNAVTANGPMGVLIKDRINTGTRNVILTSLDSFTSSSSNQLPYDYLLQTKNESNSFYASKKGLIESSKKKEAVGEVIKDLASKGMNNQELAAIVASFKAKAAFQASYVISENLDTHSNHEGTHINLQRNAWSNISQLFDYFKAVEYNNGTRLFDQTTFLVVSEFARTPALNAAKGKDHNPHCNSVLLAGKGIKGGSFTGESFVISRHDTQNGMSRHISRPIDYKTGTIIKKREDLHKDVNLIFPENIASTIGALYQSPQGFYNKHKKSAVLPNVLK